jgi:PKD repeat protein
MAAPILQKLTFPVTVGVYSEFSVTNTGGFVNSWSAVGLPNGFSINPSTGKIYGTAVSSGNISSYVLATNSFGSNGTVINFNITAPAVTVTNNFTISPDNGYADVTTYQFVSNINNAYSVLWDFGDGSTSTDKNPTHVYYNPGTYTITLNAYVIGSGLVTITKTITVKLLINESIYFSSVPPPTFAGHYNKFPFTINFTSSQQGTHYIDLAAQFSRSYESGNSNKWNFLRPEYRFLDLSGNKITTIIPQQTNIYTDNLGRVTYDNTGNIAGVSGTAQFYFVDDIYNFDLELNGSPYSTIIATLRTDEVRSLNDSFNLDNTLPSYSNSLAVATCPHVFLWRTPDSINIKENGIRDYINPRWNTAEQPIIVTTDHNNPYYDPYNGIDYNIKVYNPVSNFCHFLPIDNNPIQIKLGTFGISSNFIPQPTQFQLIDNTGYKTSGYYKGYFLTNSVSSLNSSITASIVFQTPVLSSLYYNNVLWLPNPEAGMMATAKYIYNPALSAITNNLNIAEINNFEMPIITNPDFTNNTFAVSGFHGIYSIAALNSPYYKQAWALDSELNSLYKIDSYGKILCSIDIKKIAIDNNLGFPPSKTNLLKYSSQFDLSPWGVGANSGTISISTNTDIAPDGTLSADTLQFSNNTTGYYFLQNVTVKPNTRYTFSFYVKNKTATNAVYGIYDTSNSAIIISPTSYYSKINSSTFTRISLTFTTPSNCTSINVYPGWDQGPTTTGSLVFWGAQLETGGVATPYVKTGIDPTNGIVWDNDNTHPSPVSIVLDSKKNIWVTLLDSISTLKFDQYGNLLFGTSPISVTGYPQPLNIDPIWREQNSYYLYDTTSPYEYNAINDIDLNYLQPTGVDTDTNDNVWVTYSNYASGYLVKYNSGGSLLYSYSYPVCASPQQLVVDKNNNVWIAVTNNIWDGKNCTLEKRSSTGTILSSISGFRGLNYLTLDTNQNPWFTFSYSWIGSVNTNSGQTFTVNTSSSISNWFDPNINTDETALEGIACDYRGRIYVLNSIENQVYVYNSNTKSFLNKFIINPKGFTFYTDGESQPTKMSASIWNKSLQASGDWTGYRWMNKYATNDILFLSACSPQNISLTGQSVNLQFLNKNNYEIFKVNENFDMAAQMKSLAFMPSINESTFLFDNFLSSIYGSYPFNHTDIGVSTYEKIANFVQNNSDIDFCNIDQLYSLAQSVGLNANDYKLNYPPEIKKLIDITSINQSRLMGANSLDQESFLDYNSQGKNNKGDLISSLCYTITAGNPLVLKEISLNKYRLIYTGKLYGISIYPLSELVKFIGLPNDWQNYYEFYSYVPSYDLTQLEGVIDWTNPQTTLTQNISSAKDWLKEGGILETKLSYELYKGLNLL